MSKYPNWIAVWDGHTHIPTLHFARLAESTFTSGQAYRLGVIEEKEKKAEQTRRTKEQNDKMWAMLTEISEQAIHCGRRFSADQWKVILLHACKLQEVVFLPALDNSTFIPYGGRSSHMTVAQMAEFITFMEWFGAEHGIKFRHQEGMTWEKPRS